MPLRPWLGDEAKWVKLAIWLVRVHVAGSRNSNATNVAVHGDCLHNFSTLKLFPPVCIKKIIFNAPKHTCTFLGYLYKCFDATREIVSELTVSSRFLKDLSLSGTTFAPT